MVECQQPLVSTPGNTWASYFGMGGRISMCIRIASGFRRIRRSWRLIHLLPLGKLKSNLVYSILGVLHRVQAAWVHRCVGQPEGCAKDKG